MKLKLNIIGFISNMAWIDKIQIKNLNHESDPADTKKGYSMRLSSVLILMNEKISRGVNINAYNNMQCVFEDTKPKMRVCLFGYTCFRPFHSHSCMHYLQITQFSILDCPEHRCQSWELRLKNYEWRNHLEWMIKCGWK